MKTWLDDEAREVIDARQALTNSVCSCPYCAWRDGIFCANHDERMDALERRSQGHTRALRDMKRGPWVADKVDEAWELNGERR